jgi:hypothetical protein
MNSLRPIEHRRPYKQSSEEGGDMFEVTEKASEMIKSFLKDRKEPHSIRILMQAG